MDRAGTATGIAAGTGGSRDTTNNDATITISKQNHRENSPTGCNKPTGTITVTNHSQIRTLCHQFFGIRGVGTYQHGPWLTIRLGGLR